MANTIVKIKKSGVTGNVPGSLALGELAINYTDGLLYFANATGVRAFSANDSILANAAFAQANAAFNAANSSSGTAAAYNQANAAFAQANNISSYANAQIAITQGVDTTQNTNISSAQLFANGAFTAANAVNTYAYAAYASQNITAGFANAAYTLANTVNVYSYSAYGFANTINVYAYSAYSAQNITASFANAAFAQANAAFNQANTGSSSAPAFNQANAAFIQANNAYNKANSALANTGGTLTGSLGITGSSSNIVVSQSATASDVTNTFNHLYTLGLFSGNTDQSIQVGAQNFANTANSSTDFALYNNIGTDTNNYIDLGITSKAYNTTLNGFTASQPGDGYLYSNGVNLLLGTYTPGTNMKVFIGGYTSANVSTTFNAPNTASSSNTTGTLLVQGGVGVTGNVYSDKIYTNGLYYAANGNPISTGGGGGTSLVYTAATTPPASGNNKGDQWYNTATNVLYEWATDGTSYFWLDTISPVYSNTANVNIITSGNVNTNVVFANSVYIGTQNVNSYIQSYIQQNTIHPLMFVGL